MPRPFFGKFLTDKIIEIVDLGMKEYNQCSKSVLLKMVGWTLLGVKIETSMNRLAFFHKVGPGQGEHDGEKSFRIGSLICPAVRARSYA